MKNVLVIGVIDSKFLVLSCDGLGHIVISDSVAVLK